MSPECKIDSMFCQEVLHAPPDGKNYYQGIKNSVKFGNLDQEIPERLKRVEPVKNRQSNSCAGLKLCAVVPGVKIKYSIYIEDHIVH